MEGPKRVAVAVRVRPILRSGGSHTHMLERFELEAVTRLSDTQLQVAEQKQDEACRSSCFTFDHILDQESTQLEVYEEAVVDLVDGALCGNNATILAYGQTGSGKTHTMLGDVKPNPLENDLLTANSGLFLRVLNDLMDFKTKRKDKMHVIVGLSCVEIYNDSIRDLFGGKPGDPPPPIRAVMTADDVFLPSLIVKEVTSLQAVFNEIQLAISRRQSRATESNAASSRSHCLFMIDILQQRTTAPPPDLSILQQMGKDDAATKRTSSKAASPQSEKKDDFPFAGTILRIPGQSEEVYASKILLADLAGSEKPQKSGVSGTGLAEATAINSSLTALGNVVHSLHEGGYVSYRTSSLTRLLKPTFSQPSSRVLLLAQCSPTQLTFDETISTLHFANKVKAMKVLTKTGAESEKIIFEVIENQKIYDSLLADIRIFKTDTGIGPIQRRVFPAQYNGRVYDSTASQGKPKMKERLQMLQSKGVIAAAEKEKAARIQSVAEEEATRQTRIENLIQEETTKVTSQYMEERNELKAALKEAKGNTLGSEEQILQVESSFLSVQLQVEQECEMAAMLCRFFADAKAVMGASGAKMDATIEGLTAKIHEMRAANTMSNANSDLMRETGEFDADYAMAAYAHCNSKRFFHCLMEMREAQFAALTVKLSNTELSNWQTRRESNSAAKDKPDPKHVDPSADV